MSYIINPYAKNKQVVGKPNIIKINSLLGLSLPDTEVFMYSGCIKHIKKNHPGIFENYYQIIPDIVANPHYVGKNPKVPNSIELYKNVTDYLLIAIKLDPSGYLYLSSMYDLQNGHYKVNKRLASGRIFKF